MLLGLGCMEMYDGSNALQKYIYVFLQSVFLQSVFSQSVPDLRVFYALRVY